MMRGMKTSKIHYFQHDTTRHGALPVFREKNPEKRHLLMSFE